MSSREHILNDRNGCAIPEKLFQLSANLFSYVIRNDNLFSYIWSLHAWSLLS